MKTLVLDAIQSPDTAIAQAAELLRRGELVAFPTETVYGLGARFSDEDAVRRIFTVKGRPADNPLIVHIADIADVHKVARNIPDLFFTLAEKFFPGPLAIVLEKHDAVPDSVSAGLPSVAVRMPDHDVALALIRASGEPLVAPSANRSGLPSPTTARHVLEDFNGKISAVLDGGACTVGIESTVVNILSSQTVILRPGHISQKDLESATGLAFSPANGSPHAPQAPGMKYRHYAPNAKIFVVPNEESAQALIKNWDSSTSLTNRKTAVLLLGAVRPEILENNVEFRPLLQQTLYAEFRRADTENIPTIVIIADEEIQKNAGLMNRIEKATMQ